MTKTVPKAKKRRRWITRRRFLKGSAAGGGALALGFVVGPVAGRYRRQSAIRATAEATGAFQPNAWLVVHPDERIVFTLDRVEMGQGTMTSHPMLIAEELEVDPTTIEVEFAVADRRYAHPEFGLQITGGSSSVRTSWDQLRQAGAVAREMLRRAAAEDWGVPLAECEARHGTIEHAPTGRSRTYGSLTRLAAKQHIPDPPLKPAGEHTLIGTSLDRVDAPMKVDGSAVFGINVTVPGLLNAAVIRPPVQGATVLSFDVGEAEGRPGVRAVVEIPTGVAVVADRYWQARVALDDVRVEWSAGRPELDTPAMTEQLRRLTAEPGKTVRDDGDAEAVLAAAAGDYLEAAYDLPHLAHAPMEPQNCTAPRRRRPLRDLGADAGARCGAGGGRGGSGHTARSGRGPHHVSGRWVRPTAGCRLRGRGGASVPADRCRGEDRLVPRGRHVPQHVSLSRVAGGVFRRDWVADPTSTEGASDTPYAIEDLRVELARHDPGVPIGFWRSVGHSHTAFAVESFIDELATEAGRDPFELRRELLRDAPRNRGVLEAAAEHAEWGSPLPPGRFRGIAQHFSFETYVAQVAEVSVEAGRIRVHRVVCAVDCGRVINRDIVHAQMESGIVFGLAAALKQRISYVDGHVEQSNFHDFEMLRMNEMPEVDVVIVPSTEEPTGVGEPGVPPIAPAVANALAAATGRRIRTLPFAPAFVA